MKRSLILLALCTWNTMASDAANAAEPPLPPPASQYAPVEELARLIDGYVAQVRDELVDQEAFAKSQPRVKKEASTLACLALVAGLHDQPSAMRESAAALVRAAQKLAGAEDYAAAKEAFAQLEASVKGNKPGTAALTWSKVASLGQLMKQVTYLNARTKRGARPGPRFSAAADENAGYATTLAVIAQCVMADTHEVKNASDMPKWFEYCAAMRDAAAETAAAFRSKDADAAAKGLIKLEQSCSDCHKTFRVEATE